MEKTYICSTGFAVGDLDITRILQGLNDKSRAYATYLTLATWAGFPLISFQSSREAHDIKEFLSALVLELPREQLQKASTETDTPMFYLLEYAAQFFFNASNYMGFGDNKFIPRCTKEEILKLIEGYPKIIDLYNKCSEKMYSIEPAVLHLGFHPGGVTSYYEPEDFTEEEQQDIDKLLKEKGQRVENTLIVRHADYYEIQVFSADISEGVEIGSYKGKKVIVKKGLKSETLKKVIHWLELAKQYAENDKQIRMITHLINHYQTGNVEEHEKYSTEWVHDTQPAIEMHHGFIESYRDPSGVRCEFEGFVASVDQKEGESLHSYVEHSTTILGLLPYPKEYERKTFTPPSYNAINIITFCASGMPIGINIPNYDSIRLNVGFKNVSLINVMSSGSKHSDMLNYLEKDQAEILMNHYHEVQSFHVASHELYGHGSAALLRKSDVVGKNIPDLLNPNRFISTFYEDDVTFDQAFGPSASAFEECRAEATAVYLAFKPEALNIFNVPADQHREFSYCSVLSMVNGALRGINNYSPEVCQWKQAHSRARFAILRALIMWGRGCVKMCKVDNKYNVSVDINLLDGAYDAIENLLKHLNYYKTTALIKPGQEFFAALTSMDDYWLSVRNFALTRLPKRSVSVGAIVTKNGDKYDLAAVSNVSKTTFDVAFSLATNIKLASE